MRARKIFVVIYSLFMLFILGCSVPGILTDTETNEAVIVDQIGREWDVTHARDVYGMDPDYYNYGLGVGRIPSVDEPTVIEEGDPRYPDSDSDIPVFGVDYNSEQRAYSIWALRRHEVFNDVFPGKYDQYVAVTY